MPARKSMPGARRKLTSWVQVDHSLRQIGLLGRGIEQEEAALTEKVARLREQSAARLGPLQEQRRQLERLVEEFARTQRHNMPGRSIELGHGRVGFRRTSRLVVADSGEALAALKRLGYTSCVRIRENLDLRAMRSLPDDVLAEVGARRQAEDHFFCEVARERLEPAAAAAA